MSTPAPQYPFDPTGQATSNLVTGERQTISPPDWTDYYFIVPTATPYFAESLVLTLVGTGRVLQEGVDYNPTHKFYDASLQCAYPVYGSITFLDKTLAGVIELQYQTLGGDWTLDSDQITAILANTLLDPRITTWEEIVNLPYQFPPVSHDWDIVDMVGASDIVTALNNMVTALLQSGDTGLAAHLADYNNPHHVTAAQVGLGNVQNYPMATSADATSGSSNTLYMTPSTVQTEIAQFALIPLNAHINNVANPHSVTATQVGLSAVQNYGIASTAQAQAGTATNVYMTPALTAAAITTQAITPLNAHLANYNNPHQVTAIQVGLGNVPNYAMATTAQAQAGTATDCFMSPALVQAVLQTGAGGNLQAHINDHNNPHEVTAAQVGLGNVQNFGLATTAAAQAGTDTSSYMTPTLTAAAITAQTSVYATHVANLNNPHDVTADQIGLGNVQNYAMAAQDAAITGTETTSYMSPALTSAAIGAQAIAPLNAHIANLDNPHEVTAAQVGAATPGDITTAIAGLSTVYLGIADQAADSATLGGQTLNQVIDAAVAGAELVLTYPATTITGSTTSWTTVATMAVLALQNTDPYPAPLIFEVGGGEPSSGNADSAAYRIVANAQDPTGFEITRLSGYAGSVAIGTVYDTTAKTVTFYLMSDASRNPIVLRFFSDPGQSFTADPVVTVVEPSGIVYQSQILDNGVKAKAASSMAGQVGFGLPYGSANSSVDMDRDTLVQRINIIDSTEDVSTVDAVAQPWGTYWANGLRMASYGQEAYRADSLLGWQWNATDSVVNYTRTPTGLATLISETQLPGSATIEVLVSSTDLSDMALGLVASFTDAYGQPAALHVMRDCGGLTTLASTFGALPGEGAFNLFTIGYNLFQNDGITLLSDATDLTWGDGVADADRASSTYVPQSQTSGTNGWNGKGAVAIKVVIVGTTLTISTSNFGATAGSITYVNTQTLDLTTVASHPGIAAIIAAINGGGVRWGFATYRVPTASYAIQNAPETYKRYIVRSEDTSGNETSTLYCYDGSAWVNFALVDQVMVKPGRFYYSDANNRLYHALRDGSLEAIQLVAYTPEGTSILTT